MTANGKGTATITIECGGKTKTIDAVADYCSVDGITFDGVVSNGEYVGTKHSATAENGTVGTAQGVLKDDKAYITVTFVHSGWNPYNYEWWKNDNIEIKVNNGTSHTVVFYKGEPTFSSNISKGYASTTTKDGKLVTVVELCIEGVYSGSKLKIAKGNGSNGWCPITWDSPKSITSEGLVEPVAGQLPSSLKMDGEYNEAIWDTIDTKNPLVATANGANISILGTIMEEGVLFAVQVAHNKAPEVSTNGETNWWNYMNIEFHFNDNAETQFIYTSTNQKSPTPFYGACKTEKSGITHEYISSFEIYVPFSEIGVENGTSSVDFSCSGWFETGFYWLFGDNPQWKATHTLTEDGITAK